MKNLLLFLAIVLTGRAIAQCPYYASCPTGTQLFCDYTTNDNLFWKAPPYTWNPSLMLSDLPEGDVDLSIVARDSCGGQDISVEYTLFLDLDGNDTAETVIRSNALPPPGKVLYNNVLSPNYALGDTIAFDHRTGLPDSMKYRFGLEITHFADSVVAHLKWATGIENLNYSVPKLPLGKHQILWRIEQGGVERFCEYALELKDCAPPVVECVAPFTVNVFPQGYITVWANDLLLGRTDNITPSDRLTMGMHVIGEPGTSFPLDINGNPIISFNFTCANIGMQGVELWVRDLAGNTDSCVALVTVGNNLGVCEDQNINVNIYAKTAFLNDGIEEVRFHLDGTSPFTLPFSYLDLSDMNGFGNFFQIPVFSNIVLTATKNNYPLNGVTTYDLVLISKHILGIEPLNSPYNIVAADANKSGSVTTFDMVEIRKLILGLYDSLPNNSSWRFVDKEFQFPNPQNPFQTGFPESVVFQDWPGSPNQFNFIGIKIGDVNNTAIPNANMPPPVESRAPSFLSLPEMELKTGEIYEIPIRATESADWLGLQFGLDFNPEMLDIESVESSTLPDFDQNNWAQPQAGRLTLSWSEARATPIAPSAELFRLRIKARANVQLSKVFKTSENSRLHPEAYDSEGLARPLKIVFSENNTTETAQVFAPQPNPTTAGATLPIQLLQSENLHLEVFDLTGKLLWDNDLSLEKGSHALEIPASAMPQAGVYMWRVQTEGVVRSGKIMKG